MEYRYLYKAKRIDNGEWIIGQYVNCYYPNENNKAGHFILEFPNKYHEIYISTICQCTGKHDIPENKMIYEHDFVSFLDTYSTENGYAEQYCIGEVLWDDEELCFYVTNRLSAESYEVLDDCKVIGNRFDNPELLEVGE